MYGGKHNYHTCDVSLCFKVTTWHEIKKLQDEIITKIQVVIITLIASVPFDAKKEENEVERDGKQQCGNMPTWIRRQ